MTEPQRESSNPSAANEPVLIIEDWYDGPRSGVAMFHGHPHYFERLFDEVQDDYSDRYRLTPINSNDLKFFEEAAEIFQRWSNAFDNGRTDISTHPALPVEAERAKALAAKCKSVLEQSLATQFEVIGRHSNIRQQIGRIEYPEVNSQFVWTLIPNP